MDSLLSETERELIAGTWPIELIQERTPVETKDVNEFVMRVLLGNHSEDVVVFRGGSSILGLEARDCLPSWFGQINDYENAVDFLQRMPVSQADEIKANLEYSDKFGIQRELRTKNLKRSPSRSSSEDASSEDETLLTAMRRLLERKEDVVRSAYICELRSRRNRWRYKSFNTDGKMTWPSENHTAILGIHRSKTILNKQIADAFGELAELTLCWDTQDDGIFIGGRGTGKGLHVDQVFWSNIGNNFIGHKLIAVWEKGQISSDLHATMLDYVFSYPLDQRRLNALKKAKTVALLRPGDLFIISGGTAHATLSLDFNVTSYESLITLNNTNIRHFLRTGRKSGPYSLRRGVMSRSELEDYKEHILDSLHSIAMRHFHHPCASTQASSSICAAISNTTICTALALLKDAFLTALRALRDRDSFFRQYLPASARNLISDDSDDSESSYSSTSLSHRFARRRSSSSKPFSNSVPNRRIVSTVGRTRRRTIMNPHQRRTRRSASSSSLSSMNFPSPHRSDRFVSHSNDGASSSSCNDLNGEGSRRRPPRQHPLCRRYRRQFSRRLEG
mmetsp:Transcript_13581/g.16419  ORF Transcript_13581/g.16419 Transcript_13581/m.16419 type:complete len:563 (+) Transcript_13581:2-1690(+)